MRISSPGTAAYPWSWLTNTELANGADGYTSRNKYIADIGIVP